MTQQTQWNAITYQRVQLHQRGPTGCGAIVYAVELKPALCSTLMHHHLAAVTVRLHGGTATAPRHRRCRGGTDGGIGGGDGTGVGGRGCGGSGHATQHANGAVGVVVPQLIVDRTARQTHLSGVVSESTER